MQDITGVIGGFSGLPIGVLAWIGAISGSGATMFTVTITRDSCFVVLRPRYRYIFLGRCFIVHPLPCKFNYSHDYDRLVKVISVLILICNAIVIFFDRTIKMGRYNVTCTCNKKSNMINE